MDFVRHLEKEWAVVSQAPFTFILLAVFVFVATAVIMRFLYSARIATLEERIQLRDDKLRDIKEKTGTTSPDALIAKIDELEDRVKAAKDVADIAAGAPVPPPSA